MGGHRATRSSAPRCIVTSGALGDVLRAAQGVPRRARPVRRLVRPDRVDRPAASASIVGRVHPGSRGLDAPRLRYSACSPSPPVRSRRRFRADRRCGAPPPRSAPPSGHLVGGVLVESIGLAGAVLDRRHDRRLRRVPVTLAARSRSPATRTRSRSIDVARHVPSIAAGRSRPLILASARATGGGRHRTRRSQRRRLVRDVERVAAPLSTSSCATSAHRLDAGILIGGTING